MGWIYDWRRKYSICRSTNIWKMWFVFTQIIVGCLFRRWILIQVEMFKAIRDLWFWFWLFKTKTWLRILNRQDPTIKISRNTKSNIFMLNALRDFSYIAWDCINGYSRINRILLEICLINRCRLTYTLFTSDCDKDV